MASRVVPATLVPYLKDSQDSLRQSTPKNIERAEKTNGKRGFKKHLQKAMHETTLHGIRYIFDTETESLRRCLWLLVLAACAAFFGQQLFVRVSDFISNPKSVNVERIYAQSLRFPQVIMCNHNALKITTLFPPQFRAFRVLFSTPLDQITPELIAQIAEFERRRIVFFGSDTNMTKDYLDSRHHLEDLLVDCKFRGRPCSAANFSIVLSEYGACYQFLGSIEAIDITSAGPSNGLSMTLNIEQYAYTYGKKSSAGLDIFFKEHEEPAVITGSGVSVQPGGETSIGLDVSEMEELPRPNGACDDLSLKYYDQYSRDACQLECLTDFIHQKCSCRSPGMRGDIPYCGLVTLYNCSYPLQAKFPLLPESMACDCPPRCHETRFNPTVNYAPLSQFMTATMIQDMPVPCAMNMLQGLIKAKDAYTYYSNDMANVTLRDREALNDALASPLAAYIDGVKPLYGIIHDAKSMLLQLNANSSLSSSQSSSTPLLDEINADLDALYFNLTSVDPSHLNPGAFADNQTTYSKTMLFLNVFTLGYFGRTYAFNIMGMNGTRATTFAALHQNLGITCEMIRQKVNTFLTSLTAPNSEQAGGKILTMIDNMTRAVDTVQPLLGDVLGGMRNLSQYAAANIPIIGLEAIDENYMKENVLKVNIFFNEISYTQITKQLSDSVTSLICDIGGTFGLCLGASIMSVYELLDFVISLTLFYRK